MRRRGFLAGVAAALVHGPRTWAAAGSPAFLAAARHPDGSFWLHGLGEDGRDIFSIALPARGHAAAAHPERPEAVAFARRPGTFAAILDCATGQQTAALTAPSGRHFYGHGAFSRDGEILLTTENQIETGEGRVGLWSVAEGYRRIGELPSGGIGPHDIVRLPDDGFAVANGGIRTHPNTGREKLNLDTMRPNLAILASDGSLLDVAELGEDLHQNSIRHLAVDDAGRIAFAMQWQGDLYDVPPLLGVARPGAKPELLAAEEIIQRQTQGYAGSVSFSGDGSTIGITAPRGNLAVAFDVSTGRPSQIVKKSDICGIAPTKLGMCATTGTGQFLRLEANQSHLIRNDDLSWDNHLVSVQK
ncbi:MAG: DUF1513 domain-containing protein [Pseudomonadota bacterium]